jgi:hypothetical protein
MSAIKRVKKDGVELLILVRDLSQNQGIVLIDGKPSEFVSLTWIDREDGQ